MSAGIDSVKMTIILTEERKEKIYDNCSSLLQSNQNITVREFDRHLENSKVEFLRRVYGDFDK